MSAPRRSVIAEALAYVGGALAVIFTGVCLGVLFDGLRWRDEDGILIASLGASVIAGALWHTQRMFVQQAALGVSLAVAVGTATAHLPHDDFEVVGLALWGLGLAWLALAAGGLSRRNAPPFSSAEPRWFGGSSLTTSLDWGLALACATTVVLVAVAVLGRDLWLLGVGAGDVLIITPILVHRFWEGELAVPLALLAAGVLLIGLGVLVARRRRAGGTGSATGIPGWAAVAATAVVILAVTAAVLSIGQRWS